MIPEDLEETRGSGGDVPPVRAEWGGLRLITQIGAGAFGRVYRAHDQALARDVALKIITLRNPEDATTILREGQMLARVRHHNVVTVYSVQRVGDEVGLVMELVDGETLADIVSTRGPMGAEEATLIGLALSQALAAVHAAGVLHRDVKARNVMREKGGRIVLMDFGLGLDASRGSDRQSTIAGTPPYMAPELFVDVPASVTSDLYSLGVLLFYLVTREYPVPDQGALATALSHAKREQRYLADLRPDLPPKFVEVVERALKLDPALRYRSAGAMMLALSEARSPWKSRAFTWTAGVLAAVGGVLGLGLLTSAAFNATLGRMGGFSDDTIGDWLAFGVRSLVTPLVYTALVLAAWFALRTLWRVLRLRPGLRPIVERTGSSAERMGHAVGMSDPAGLGVWLLIAQGIGAATLFWWFFPVFDLLVNFPD